MGGHRLYPPAIQEYRSPDTTIVSATPVAAPAYCDIFGYVHDARTKSGQFPTRSTHRMERFFAFLGNGGFAGSLNTAVLSVVTGASSGDSDCPH